MATKMDLDEINLIKKFQQVSSTKSIENLNLKDQEIKCLCLKSIKLFALEPSLLEIHSPVTVIGDLRGQCNDLFQLFEFGGDPSNTKYIFLGNYIGIDKCSIETICLLLLYKIMYPENIFLLRGNHECVKMSKIIGFKDDCKKRFNKKIWELFSSVFDYLPLAGLIDNRIFCVHSGLSPEIDSLYQIKEVKRPVDIPDRGLINDLLWSVPDINISGWNKNKKEHSLTFGHDIIQNFLKKNKLDLICQSNQLVQNGYQFFPGRKLVSLFSAPNHLTNTNSAAIMSVNETFLFSFKILRPLTIKQGLGKKEINDYEKISFYSAFVF